jgi:hypothetical protein
MSLSSGPMLHMVMGEHHAVGEEKRAGTMKKDRKKRRRGIKERGIGKEVSIGGDIPQLRQQNKDGKENKYIHNSNPMRPMVCSRKREYKKKSHNTSKKAQQESNILAYNGKLKKVKFDTRQSQREILNTRSLKSRREKKEGDREIGGEIKKS